MTLSTASPQLSTKIPVLTPHWIGPIVIHTYRMSKRGGAPGGNVEKRRKEMERIQFEEEEVDEDEEEDHGGRAYFKTPDATPLEGKLSTSYIIEGLSTIPSDTDATSQAHKVTVAVVELTADLEWIAVPKEQPSAFLCARVKNTSPYLFLPGRANIFLDDNFVAKSQIEVSSY